VHPRSLTGARNILIQAWNRYGVPVAITEAHLGCTSDEQVRWLAEIWTQAEQACLAGADVRAVTTWGLLGLYNWSNLCTRDIGDYEPGVFNVSSGTPRPTAVTALVKQIIRGQPLTHVALQSPGWWRRSSRLTIPPPQMHDFGFPPQTIGPRDIRTYV
jgi:dTDP-4-dehydrorhamnose reductase